MSDPSLAIQRAIVPILRAAVTLVNGRVYDRPPQHVVFPYVQYGETQTVDQSLNCLDMTKNYVTLHIWSRAVGQEECKRIMAQARAALNRIDIDLPAVDGWCWYKAPIYIRQTRIMGDPDGVTSHGIVDFEISAQLKEMEL